MQTSNDVIHVIFLNIPLELKLDLEQLKKLDKSFIKLDKLDKNIIYLFQYIAPTVFV